MRVVRRLSRNALASGPCLTVNTVMLSKANISLRPTCALMGEVRMRFTWVELTHRTLDATSGV